MPSCLGINIENNIIKYAKVFKERENTRIETCGVKFYDNIDEALNQIIEETYSKNTQVSINLSDEMYNYLEIFSLLEQKDMRKAIATEFEYMCDEKGYNKNMLDSRYVIVNDLTDKEKVKVLHVSVNKNELYRQTQKFDKYRLVGVSPLPVVIKNLTKNEKGNIAILNIENKTTLTIVIDGQVQQVNTIESGMEEIFDKINKKENSYNKVYEILKNTTLYTAGNQELQSEENEYLEDIVPMLYNIITTVNEMLSKSVKVIDKLYITGTATAINNIDLYIQDNLSGVRCEILKPYFVQSATSSIIKDYIEANSAISLALQGLGDGIKEVNFKVLKLSDKFPVFTHDSKSKTKNENPKKINFKFDLSGSFSELEMMIIRTIAGVLLVMLTYGAFSVVIGKQIENKKEEIEENLKYSNQQIANVVSDTEKVKTRTSQYNEFINNLDNINEEITEKYKTKNAIPNLLTHVMSIIPETVQILSVENTNEKHIIINAQSAQYEQIGFFLSELKLNGILLNVKSDLGVKSDSLVKVTIEGDLP